MSVSIVFETHSVTKDTSPGSRPAGSLADLARELGRRRRDDNLSAVFTSDLARAAETAANAFGEVGRRVLVIGHVATRFALDHALRGVPLEALLDEPFYWQEGWEYTLC
ncbi:MAG: hypothetical protein ACRDMV_05055 [Streptosporangiales bacterium]